MNWARYKVGVALVYLGIWVMPEGQPRTELRTLLAIWANVTRIECEGKML